MLKLIGLYLLLFLTAIILGIFGAPDWVLIIVFILFVLAVLYRSFYPLLFEKDINKITNYMRKSRQYHFQFIYHLFNGDDEEAEKTLHLIRSKQLKNIDHIMLLLKQQRYTEAKVIHLQLKENAYKWYYGALIAINEDDEIEYEECKSRLKEPIYLSWLEMEEKVRSGRKKEALAMLDKQIVNLRGLKLLSAAQYKKELEQK